MIEGEKIRLIALEPEDLDILYQWENDTSIWPVSSTSSPFSHYTLNEYLKSATLDLYSTKQLRLVIQKKDDGQKIGFVDLFDFDPMHKRAGVGILIGEKEERGKGFAKEALELLGNYAFNTLHFHQLYCHVQLSNSSSIKLFENAGFVRTAVLKDWIANSTEFEDVVFFQLIVAH